jgi:hypothetical protein
MNMGAASKIPNKRGAFQTPVIPNTIFADIALLIKT